MTAWLRRTLPAEVLKLRRTLALWLAFLLPAVPCALQFINYAQRGESLLPADTSAWAWMAQNILILWCVFLLPLFVGLETSLVAGIEHQNQGFKHLHALPVPRPAIHGAKLMVTFALIGVSMLSLWAFTIGTGLVLRIVKPGLGFEDPAPVWRLAGLCLLSYLASWSMLAMHAFISLRWPSLVLNVGIALAAVFFSFAVSSTRLWKAWPWALPANVESLASRSLLGLGEAAGPSFFTPLVVGMLGGLAIAVVGGRHLARRDPA